jgi:hypothetical protein
MMKKADRQAVLEHALEEKLRARVYYDSFTIPQAVGCGVCACGWRGMCRGGWGKGSYPSRSFTSPKDVKDCVLVTTNRNHILH